MNSKNNFKFDDISINIKERVINELYDKIDVENSSWKMESVGILLVTL